MKRIAIYSPYLDTLGGGERYIATAAEILSSLHKVDFLLDLHLSKTGKNSLKKDLEKQFALDLAKVNFVVGPIGPGSDSVSRLFYLGKYDVLFYLTDGSIFFPTAKKNLIHIQSPLIGQPSQNFWGALKLKAWSKIVYNSNFTKLNSQSNWPISSVIIYPPVNVEDIQPLKKEKYILSVGRFFGFLKEKKHEILIRAFLNLQKRQIKGWSLHLAGGATSPADFRYIEQLKRLSDDLPVFFYPNIEYSKLTKLYGQSTIYWHAAGFSETDPTKMEHFGITTVEAMAAGCIPIVIAKGGQTEIVDNGLDGYLWETLDQLEDQTLMVINERQITQIANAAIKKSKQFSKEKFKEAILNLINE